MKEIHIGHINDQYNRSGCPYCRSGLSAKSNYCTHCGKFLLKKDMTIIVGKTQKRPLFSKEANDSETRTQSIPQSGSSPVLE